MTNDKKELRNGSLSSGFRTECECCHKERMCWLYVLFNGVTAWICDECRIGTGG